MAKKTKTIKARTPASLQAKVDAAKAEGWKVFGDTRRYNGELCVMVAKDGT